jgi:tetratricopeptide (TPR) repeat protein
VNQSSNDLSGTVTGPVVQAGHVEQMHLAPQVPTALAGLPPASAEFTGRAAALREVEEALRPAADGAVRSVLALVGTAGVGKTALALRAAHGALAAGWFPGGTLFIDLQGYDGNRYVPAESAVSAFLSALGVPDEMFPRTREGRLSLYRSKLAELTALQRGVLIVLDNASALEQVKSLLPGSAEHQVLLTSRHVLDLSSRIMDLDVLPRSEAVDLIARTLHVRRPDDTRARDEPAAVRELARLCGYLPLALAVTAAILAGDPEQSVGELAEALRDGATRLAELSYSAGRSVAAAFALSYARLTPDEARMFRLLSINPGQQVSVAASAALTGLKAPQARKLLLALRAAHMIEAGEPRGWVRCHDLLRLFAEQRCAEEEEPAAREAAERRLLAHYRDSARSAVERIVAAARAGGGDEEAEQWLDTERLNLRRALDLTGPVDMLLSLAHDVSWFLRRQQEWHAGLAVCERAVGLARDDGDHGRQALAHYDHGDFLKNMQAFHAASGAFTRALALYRGLGDREREAMTLHSMGTAARRRGRYEEAQEHYTAALSLFRALGDPAGVAMTRYNLGNTARGREQYALAREHLAQALDAYADLGHAMGRARTHEQLGRLAALLDRPETARDHWHQARAGYEEAGAPQYVELVVELLETLEEPHDED